MGTYWRTKIEMRPSGAELQRAIRALGSGVRVGVIPVWRKLLPLVIAEQGKIVMSRGAYGFDGTTWAPYTASTAKRKGMRFPTLWRTGKLISQVTSTKGLHKMGPWQMRFGTMLPYAAAIQWGRNKRGAPKATRKRGAAALGRGHGGTDVPGRKFLGHTKNLTQTAQQLMDEYLAMIIRNSRLGMMATGRRGGGLSSGG
jgi:phage gpG-like protein